jgi:hypothetical protein
VTWDEDLKRAALQSGCAVAPAQRRPVCCLQASSRPPSTTIWLPVM